MKKICILAVCVLCFGIVVYAQSIPQFTVPLGVGSTQKTEVMHLQQFLIAQGFLKVAATGNYLSLTVQAVKAFQVSQSITPTGYFGPLTMVAANKKLTATVSAVTAQPVASVSVQSVKNNVSQTADLMLAGSSSHTITWQTNGYPANVGVNVNLLRKTSDIPAMYTLIRQLASDAPNTGSFAWTPQQGESGSDVYIEVTCSTSHQFAQGCQVSQIVKAF